jgi:hypothetical protein
MTSGPNHDELRARERRTLNGLTLEQQHGVETAVAFACECGALACSAHICLTPAEFAAFRRNFRAFVVVPGHDTPRRPDQVIAPTR